ncbi:hypothetical protein PAECIP111893_04187 [Paenibacillus plantiphilus]|uniref:site-specific DNA-methyltransferase (adenine-specific) n=1 Tax=Paenibacillus plantiphilus TaxID=2905650 RepID=A0ABM9CM56_9BACL|nr:N-6 DNA methylase [Paenibacillus plantiphilus]CAH1216846.1 hypothetical protein PAECIP111893_04187 [Paenibacillus plantiphilus]
MTTLIPAEDLYRSYYTKSEYIREYMINRLEPAYGHKILEPSAGDGEFIEALLKTDPNLDITALELNPEAVAALKCKYDCISNVNIVHTDTLLDTDLDHKAAENGYYDRIIGNPPYGAWQNYEKRGELKSRYSGSYVKETYSLFLQRCVSLLKKSGRLTFIIPDTFLNLHMHQGLREYLLQQTIMKEILLIPSSFFPGVKFGYSNLAIITVERAEQEAALGNMVTIIHGLKKPADIAAVTRGSHANTLQVATMSQQEIYNSVGRAFLFQSGQRIRLLINNSATTIGDISDCVTGFYSGDNSRFLRVASSSVRNLSRCEGIKPEEISIDYLTHPDLLNGLAGDRCYIPIVKGNAKGYLRDNDWFLNWSQEAVRHYRTDAKARFQNARFYFQEGIALPLVKSSKVSASLIQQQIFDQSIVGIFPREKGLLYVLLAMLNSSIVNTIIHAINHTANNSANYIKKIPFIIPPDSMLERIDGLTRNQLLHWQTTGSPDLSIDEELNRICNDLYNR